MSIAVAQLSKSFGAFKALSDVDLTVNKGELVALLGPSGSGKTTLLRIIAGLEWPDQGDVKLDNISMLDRGAAERSVGFVFQHYALFRHMDVFENVAFGLRVRPKHLRPSNETIREKVMGLLNLMQIGWLADRNVNQLSGGQRQRVALARALAIEPSVLLLDEPFGALDAKVRKELRRWLRHLHNEMDMTTVFVTHDQEEALELADRVVVMGQGRIEQIGTPQEIYADPATPFVFEFLGNSNRLPCRIVDGRAELPGLTVDPSFRPGFPSGEGMAYIRPHDIEIAPSRGTGEVRFVSVTGPTVKLEVVFAELTTPVEVEMPLSRYERLSLAVGDRVGLVAQKFKVFANGKSDDIAAIVREDVPSYSAASLT
jgi:sulfate transport system ATP-binding protein